MANKGTKKTAHRPRGEKKRKEEKSLPAVLDVAVRVPGGRQVLLKGISTDRILDIRRLLAVHVETAHFTNYSLSHEVRGGNLREAQEVAALKPCVLDLVEEEYSEEACVAHVRRLLDIVSCTTSFGPSAKDREAREGGGEQGGGRPGEGEGAEERDGKGRSATWEDDAGRKKGAEGKGEQAGGAGSGERKLVPFKGKPEAAAAMAAAAAATEEGDMTGMCPHESKLGQFYEFLSASHLVAPIQYIRRASRPLPSVDDFFLLDVRLCSGKLVAVTAGRAGFSAGRHVAAPERSLLALLRRLSRAFARAYADLQDFFLDRNKFGNTPFGFRSNTWLVPPPAAAQPEVFPALPAEDARWGGHGGGQARPGDRLLPRDWARDFRVLAAMAGGTAEERLLRDRQAFLVHSLFVDAAVRRAVAAIEDAAAAAACDEGANEEVAEREWRKVKQVVTDNMRITVMKDPTDASAKGVMKLDVEPETGLSSEEVAERCLLKGVTADESTAVHDTGALGTVLLHHRGYSARVQAEPTAPAQEGEELPRLEIEPQPDGGANALNPNSLRVLLHSSSSSSSSSAEAKAEAAAVLRSALRRSVARLEAEAEALDEAQEEGPRAGAGAGAGARALRWELGACWAQHLQTPPPAAEKGPAAPKDGPAPQHVEPAGEGEEERQGERTESEAASEEMTEGEKELSARLGERLFQRLKESKTGLHKMTMTELKAGAMRYYSEVALPKLVADFGSLELSPVDGRTLTDFMHTRGLQMRSLGRVAEKSENLPHVRSLCVHEMVTRACKHLLRAVVAAAQGQGRGRGHVAPAVAAALNAMLGRGGPPGGACQNSSGGGEGEETAREGEDALLRDGDVEEGKVGEEQCMEPLVWRWTQAFVRQRYRWEVDRKDWMALRRLAVLRALCLKVGIEVAPRTYDLSESHPFRPEDIISMFPIYKHVACTTADGRMLLESSKTALDKGKLDEAVSCGTKALARLVAVCGPYHRMTAGAYSLLAVVLYHTGDFNQATIYQQKALDINERELGLDHPDTMKSYGDLAVFYYRLQHTELALKYVNRALYLLHLTCGPAHPNTAATYINIAMMEEGLGNVHLALRYLHEALQCNRRLLGPDHIQTAASYHAIAIALSLMEAYSLSRQHEQTTLQILQDKLGPDDLRTQDAAAWLEYFDSKAAEQMEAQRTGAPKPDASIASKGHLSVSDLLEFINEEEKKRMKSLEVTVATPLAKKKGGKGKVASKSVKAQKRGSEIASTDLSENGGESDGELEKEVNPGGTASRVGAVTVDSVETGEVHPERIEEKGTEVADVDNSAGAGQPIGDAAKNSASPAAAVGPAASKEALGEAQAAPLGGGVSAAEEAAQQGGDGEGEDEGWQEAGHKGRGAGGAAGRRLQGGGGGQGLRHSRPVARGGPQRGGPGQRDGGHRHPWGNTGAKKWLTHGEAGREARVVAGGKIGAKGGPGGGSLPVQAGGAPPQGGDQLAVHDGAPASGFLPGGHVSSAASHRVAGKPGSLAAASPPAAGAGQQGRGPIVSGRAGVGAASASKPAKAEDGPAGSANAWAAISAGRPSASASEQGVKSVAEPAGAAEGRAAGGKEATAARGTGRRAAAPAAPVAASSRAATIPVSKSNPASLNGAQGGGAAGGGQHAVIRSGQIEGPSATPAVGPVGRGGVVQRLTLSWKDVALAPPGTCSLAHHRAGVDSTSLAVESEGNLGGKLDIVLGQKASGESTKKVLGEGAQVIEQGDRAEATNEPEQSAVTEGECPVEDKCVVASEERRQALRDLNGVKGEEPTGTNSVAGSHDVMNVKDQLEIAVENAKPTVVEVYNETTECASPAEGVRSDVLPVPVTAGEAQPDAAARTEHGQAAGGAGDLLSKLSPTAPPFMPTGSVVGDGSLQPVPPRHGQNGEHVRFSGGKNMRHVMAPPYMPPPTPNHPQNYPGQVGRPPQFMPMPGGFHGPAPGRPVPYPPVFHPQQMHHGGGPPHPHPQNGYLPVMHGVIPGPPPFMRHHPHFAMVPPLHVGGVPPIYQGILRPPPGAYPAPPPPLMGPPLPPGVGGGVMVPFAPTVMNPLAQEFVPLAAAKRFNPLAAEFVPGLPWDPAASPDLAAAAPNVRDPPDAVRSASTSESSSADTEMDGGSGSEATIQKNVRVDSVHDSTCSHEGLGKKGLHDSLSPKEGQDSGNGVEVDGWKAEIPIELEQVRDRVTSERCSKEEDELELDLLRRPSWADVVYQDKEIVCVETRTSGKLDIELGDGDDVCRKLSREEAEVVPVQ